MIPDWAMEKLKPFIKKLEEEGLSEKIITRAILLAYNYAESQSYNFVPPELMEDPEIRRRVIEYNLPKGIKNALKWVKKFYSLKSFA